MLISRWMAPATPDLEQINEMFRIEGLVPQTEEFQPGSMVKDHRHPFDEIRMIVAGQMLFDIAGNKLLLRAGDKILIPANTKHSMKMDHHCLSVYTLKPF